MRLSAIPSPWDGAIPQEVFDIGILNEDFHSRLLADVDRFAATAGIPVHFVWSRLSMYCTEKEVLWVKRIRLDKGHGLCYMGEADTPIENRMMAIAGACLRNYTDARVMSVQMVAKHLKNESMPQPTVLLIPNFCPDRGGQNYLASWESSAILGLLYARLASNMKTVLHIESVEALEKNYGAAFWKHIQAHYTFVSAS